MSPPLVRQDVEVEQSYSSNSTTSPTFPLGRLAPRHYAVRRRPRCPRLARRAGAPGEAGEMVEGAPLYLSEKDLARIIA